MTSPRRPWPPGPPRCWPPGPCGVPALIVPDVTQALGRLARAVVDSLPDLRIAGITGSAGKTTTKDLAAQLVEHLGPTVAPRASWNNEIGHPLTVLRATAQTRYLVLELSARGPGHIAHLCRDRPAPVRRGALCGARARGRVRRHRGGRPGQGRAARRAAGGRTGVVAAQCRRSPGHGHGRADGGAGGDVRPRPGRRAGRGRPARRPRPARLPAGQPVRIRPGPAPPVRRAQRPQRARRGRPGR